MALIYALERPFKSAYKPPRFMVGGNEEGSPFRRVYRSRGLAERFHQRMKDRPRVTNLFLVELP